MNLSKSCLGTVLVFLCCWGNEIRSVQGTVWPLARIETEKMPQGNAARRPLLLQSDFASPDCSGPSPTGFTRIFIAYRSDGSAGTGILSDAFDGSSPEKFDTLLRSRSESGVTHLIVCIGPGVYQTDGVRDFLLGEGHLDRLHPAGFTVNQGWRIHGSGGDKTTLRLADLFMDPSTGQYLKGVIIGTYNLESSGLEISDLALDGNYPTLKPRYRADLQLQALYLRSNHGHQWVHDVHVLNMAGEVMEDFPVEISSLAPSTSDSPGNLVEHVTLDHWAAGRCTAIVIANSEGEVRYNTVIGYHIAYGGWSMSNVNFHDNQAIETTYGFNVDSWQNRRIVIERNLIVHPLSYGFVIGGNGDFSDFSILDNTVTVRSKGPGRVIYGLIFQGHVRSARVLRNRIIADQPIRVFNVFGFYEKNTLNVSNIFQANIITESFNNTLQGSDCVYGNVSESGKDLSSLRDTQKTGCRTEP
jgi:hypothetical protein